jgi:polysaccharide export outer membrane protein
MLLVAALLSAAAAAGTGCAKSYTDFSAFVHQPQPLVTATEYRLAPPDEVLIASKRVREINGHRETIRPDGKLTLPLLGSVFVAGKTCEEISAELAQLAHEYYEDADVSVRVISFRSKKVYVFGEVGLKGPYPYSGSNTVLDVLAQAQPNRLADTSRILVLRPNNEGELIKRMTVDMDKMVQEGDTTLNAVLEEGDIIYVPPTGTARLMLAVNQLLLPINPVASLMSGPADIARSVGEGGAPSRAYDDGRSYQGY